jgi:predicted AlkP superfamily phosphohydrolase/phosphomutase
MVDRWVSGGIGSRRATGDQRPKEEVGMRMHETPFVERKRCVGKLLIIGLDSATFDIINPLIERGKLPHLARLMREGIYGELLSTVPPLSPAAWSSFATGMNIGKHGIYSFTEPKGGTYEVRLVSAHSRTGHTFWRLLSDKGKRVGILNVPMTYPPEPVNGFIIAGLDSPNLDSLFVYPNELRTELLSQFPDYVIEYPLLGAITPETGPTILEKLHEMTEVRLQTAKWLMQKEQWDLFVVVFIAIDRIHHFFWHAMEPCHYRYHEPGAEKVRTAIEDIYIKADEMVGELLVMVDDETDVIIMSDHGAGPFDGTLPYLNLNNWLAEEGLLHLRGETLKQRTLRTLRSVMRRSLPPAAKTALKKRLAVVQEKVQSELYFGIIDWHLSKAYATFDEFLARGIRINLKGREPEGIVEPGTEYEPLRDELVSRISILTHPQTGQPVVKKVYRREELYWGPRAESLPDLVVLWDEGAFCSGQEPQSYQEKFPLTKVGRSGEHRREGLFIARGPHFRRGVSLPPVDIIDIAPTVLYLMGSPIPSEMDGKVIAKALTPELLELRSLEYEETHYLDQDNGGVGFSEEETCLIEERLQGLGYIE